MYRVVLSGISLNALTASFGSNNANLLKAMEKRAESIIEDFEPIKEIFRSVIRGDILPSARYDAEQKKRLEKVSGVQKIFPFLMPKDPRFIARENWNFATAICELADATCKSFTPKEEEHNFVFLTVLEKKFLAGVDPKLKDAFSAFLFGRPLFGRSGRGFDDREGDGWYGYLTNQEGAELLAHLNSQQKKGALPDGSGRFIDALQEIVSRKLDVWAAIG